MENKMDMGTPITGGSADLGEVIIGGDTVNTPFRVIKVGGHTPYVNTWGGFHYRVEIWITGKPP